MASLDRTARQIFFWEFLTSFALSLRYFFGKKATIKTLTGSRQVQA